MHLLKHAVCFGCFKRKQNCAMSFTGSGPQKPEGVGKLSCNSIWFPGGSLCSLKGKEDMLALSSRQALLPDSDLPHYHSCKEAERPLTRAGLSPPLLLQPAFLQRQNSAFFHLFMHDLSTSYSVLPLSPTIPLQSFNFITNMFSTQKISPVLLIASPWLS